MIWDTSRAETRSTAEILEEYWQLASGQGLTAVSRGDAAEIWSGCQLQSIDQLMAVQVLGLPLEQIKINTLLPNGAMSGRNWALIWTRPLTKTLPQIMRSSPISNARA